MASMLRHASWFQDSLVSTSDGDFAGLIASRRGTLAQAMSVLAVEEEEGPDIDSAALGRMVDAASASGALEHSVLDAGDTSSGPVDVDLTLAVPLAAHASIEPRTAVARFGDDGDLDVWTGTQDPFFVRDSLADAFGLGRDKVVVHGMRMGGGFGARTIVAAEMEAARLAKLCGRPVKVQWSRSDEFRAGFHRPPSSHRIRLSADAAGRITNWHHAFPARGTSSFTASGDQRTQFPTSSSPTRASAPHSIPPLRGECHRVPVQSRLPVRDRSLAGLGSAANNDNVMKVGLAGDTLSYRDQELTLHRNGYPEQVWMDLSYSPVHRQPGRPVGVWAIVVETTRVLAERRNTEEFQRLQALFEQAPTLWRC